MNVKRRGFFGLLAGAVAAGPKVAAETAKQAGVALQPFSADGANPVESLVSHPSPMGSSWAAQRLARVNLLKLLRPGFVDKKARMSARHVNRLDLDLAAMQSMSLAAKITAQRERNYQRALGAEEEWIKLEVEEDVWNRMNGQS